MINGWPEPRKAQRGYVLSAQGWHEGVIGIVASRLVEFHNRPVIIIAEDEDQRLGKGSGRSVSGVDLHQRLMNTGHLLEKFGGHSAACGLTIDLENIQDFQNGFAEQADSVMADREPYQVRHVDALVCGREMTLDLADELSRMEPFGLGNPSIELLATGTRISAARATRDGRHLQCLVEAGGARSSAIGFGQAYLLEKLKPAGQWDVAFRLERNEFNGSVAPQLILREIFPGAGHKGIPSGMCDCHCDYECPQRMAGDDIWKLLSEKYVFPANWNHESETRQDNLASLKKQLEGRLIDRRGLGDIPGQVAKIVSGGQNVVLLVSDVARRRHVLSKDLPLANYTIENLLLMSSRCNQDVIKERSLLAAAAGQTVSMMDFTTASLNPDILACHDHLVFIDPPPGRASFVSMINQAPDAWIHLFYCADEVQFTGKVLEHEYDLRAPMTKLYKHLKAGKTWPLDETTERLLLAGGKYLRQPMLVARCLRVLEELDLISIEKNSGKPILTLLESGKTSLERSSTYNQVQAFYEGCLKFLSKSLSEKVT
ncbi:MAG: DHHA1 domain-containing protein, partial [Thermoleophilia bacterium]